METLTRPIFVKMIPLARQIFHQKCPEMAFSAQNLPNFRTLVLEFANLDISLAKIAKKHNLALTKLDKFAKKYTLGWTGWNPKKVYPCWQHIPRYLNNGRTPPPFMEICHCMIFGSRNFIASKHGSAGY